RVAGQLPQELANLEFLELLNVFNNSLSGFIPSSIFNISTLSNLALAYNKFSGSLRSLTKLSLFNLEELYLQNNELSGEIPISITNASKLTLLDMGSNSFSGTIPNFSNLRLLRRLVLLNNNLSGAKFPDQELEFLSPLANCRSLEIVVISGNPLNGIIPISIGNFSTSIWWFSAQECNIKGVIPATIGNLSSLQRLSLDRNQLTGFIPPTIGKLNQLQRLLLFRNRLQGRIPSDLCLLSNMGDLYLYENILRGPIPECFGEVRSLRTLYLYSNKLNSTIPSNLWSLKDLLFLNLSSNYFSGQLSSQIASLRVINQLDLSHNKFEGSIPPSLGNIRGLSTLDLSNNSLSGSIPESLEGLKFLQYFNVSYNNLDGEIPTRGPFVNFTAQSFFYNSALCGASKFQVPPCIKKNIKTSRHKKVHRLMKYILPPFILLIILATIIILVLMRRRILKRVPAPAHNSFGVDAWRRISYIEIVRGTNDFSESNLIGEGGYGSVLKATLSDGLDVAVKVFNLQLERAIRSFDTECEILSNIRHRNLVRIVGCCSNPEFKALILEYMPNGSLEKWLHSENYCLNLIQRLQIAIDVASALEYLHHGHTFPVVHCDIKPVSYTHLDVYKRQHI
ncbi:probable LRR receptor-like serine/threonine-protein kinase at3g47570, partial [Phtheirospermum japonicum]